MEAFGLLQIRDGSGSTNFLRREGETRWAEPVLGPSGLLSPLVKSDGLVMIPLGMEGLFKGEEAAVQLFGGS